MKYSDQQIEEANALDIVEVARRLGIDVKERQGVFMACCVDHTENTPSMQIGSKKEEYSHMTKCYACGATHNVVGLVMTVRNCRFREAMEWINSEFTIKASPPSPSPIGRGVGHIRQQTTRMDSMLVREAVYGTLREVQQFVSLNNALSRCMRHYFAEEVVTRVTMDYLLGVDYERFHSDHTLFASIDAQDRVHNIKLQEYCTMPTSPMFCHSMKGRTMWVGKKIINPTEEGLCFDTDCLFGEHLLKRYPEKVVALTESPKNAIVGACHEPRLLWLACGNKGMLKRQLLEVLRGRDVIVYPDRDAIEEWTQKIESMRGLAHFRMADFCQDTSNPENGKMDIADLILSERG